MEEFPQERRLDYVLIWTGVMVTDSVESEDSSDLLIIHADRAGGDGTERNVLGRLFVRGELIFVGGSLSNFGTFSTNCFFKLATLPGIPFRPKDTAGFKSLIVLSWEPDHGKKVSEKGACPGLAQTHLVDPCKLSRNLACKT